MDKKALLRSLNQPDEKLFIAKVLDQADFSCKKHTVQCTEFLSPEKQALVLPWIQKLDGLDTMFFGGCEDTERKMLGFSPDYRGITADDFPIAALEIIRNPHSPVQLSHRDYLGAVLSTGVERSKLGDFAVTDTGAIVFVEEKIAEFLLFRLERIGKVQVKVQKKALDQISLPQKLLEEKTVTLPSLRLDALLAAVYPLSRGKVQQLIVGEKAQLNWKVVIQVSHEIAEGDVFSLRGYGRGKVLQIAGKTKKDRIVVRIGRYI